MGLDYFEAIIYVNLDHRTDRKRFLLDQLIKLGAIDEKIYRISAIYDSLNGHRGCTKSHIEAIDFAIKKNFKNVLILEDDCFFIQNKPNLQKSLSYFFENIKIWDVFLLGSQTLLSQNTKFPYIKRVLKSYLAHAYAINNHYFSKLKNCYLKSLEELENDAFFIQTTKAPIDQMWQKLQAKDRWYILEKLIAIQKECYSDIEKKELLRKIKIK